MGPPPQAGEQRQESIGTFRTAIDASLAKLWKFVNFFFPLKKLNFELIPTMHYYRVHDVIDYEAFLHDSMNDA